MNWNDYFFAICDVVSQKSKDSSTKVGCVIATKDHRILSVGFNGFPSGVQDLPERYNDRDVKYNLIVHSEANAIATAARQGVSLRGATLYVPWLPCNHCAGLIIQAGIDTVVVGNYMSDGLSRRWAKAWEYTLMMFGEAHVEVVYA